MIFIPAVVNNDPVVTIEQKAVVSVRNEVIAHASQFPLIRVNQIKKNGEEHFKKFQSLPVREVLEDLKKAGAIFKQMEFQIGEHEIRADDYIRLVSESTGLTANLVKREIDEIADILAHLDDILAVQVPGPLEESLDNNFYLNHGYKTGYFPAGKTLAVKLPGNIPTICLYWLIPFSQKRPVFLIPPQEDYFTHYLLLEAIKKANPLLSSFITFLPSNDQFQAALFDIADQIMIPESASAFVQDSMELLSKTYFIHYGRTKFLITNTYSPEHADILFRRMTWNDGRTCTGLTSVITTNSIESLTRDLANKLIHYYENRIEESLPAFPLDKAIKINEKIDDYISRGDALDIVSQARNKPRLLKVNNRGILFPTVLLIKNRNTEAFGFELPFPFISVIQLETDEEILEFAKNSLILSVLSDRRELISALCSEKSILKVFADAHVERGYNYIDPHEGYMLDFLNQKKAVLI